MTLPSICRTSSTIVVTCSSSCSFSSANYSNHTHTTHTHTTHTHSKHYSCFNVRPSCTFKYSSVQSDFPVIISNIKTWFDYYRIILLGACKTNNKPPNQQCKCRWQAKHAWPSMFMLEKRDWNTLLNTWILFAPPAWKDSWLACSNPHCYWLTEQSREVSYILETTSFCKWFYLCPFFFSEMWVLGKLRWCG